jgi:competence protein ComEC
MLLFRPAWANSIGFQLSAAATAGLTLSARGLEQQLLRCCPSRMRWLASAIAVSWSALVWTLPLQLLHFGSTPLYALVANFLAAP